MKLQPSAAQAGLVIFDGDDTLWRTQELYDNAKREFVVLLRGESFTTPNIIEKFEEIDTRRVRHNGFSPSRFIGSMLITYSLLCEQENRMPTKAMREHIKKVGLSVLRSPKLFNDTIPTLKRLRESSKLILATKGTQEIQRKKVDRLQLASYFDKIYYSHEKTAREYRKIMRENHVASGKIWVVGNSMRSDINPALELGLKAIWIPRRTWRYEDVAPEDNTFFVAKSLREASRIILSPNGERGSVSLIGEVGR